MTAAPAPDQIEYRLVKSLLAAKRNARTHSAEQIAKIAASIEAFGWTNPELIDEAGNLVAGHGRRKAAELIYKKNGVIRSAITGQEIPKGTIPVLVARGWSDAQKRAYILADNKIALDAGWDEGLLKIELTELQALNFDIAPIGFSVAELQPMLGGAPEGEAPKDGIEDAPGSNYKEQYGVIIICADEAEQKATYDSLLAAGRKVKVVTT